MDQWETIRLRCVRDGEAVKVVARELGLSRNTVRKFVRSIVAPHPKARSRARLLDTYQASIDELLRTHPHITAIRIGRYLRENVDAGIRVEESTLRKYVAARRRQLQPREAFVRAAYEPGDQAQFDFTPVSVMLAGVLVVVQVFVMRLSYSGRWFARASMRCDQPALFAGILEALTTFGGVPREALFDNATTAVKRVLQGRRREENAAFRAFCGALALIVQFAAPAKGNEKGGVEGVNRYLQNNVFLPTLEVATLEDLNELLAQRGEDDAARIHSSHHESIAARFEREERALRPLPKPCPRPCVVRYARINKFSEVVCETNRYSVPTKYAYRDAMIEIYDTRLRVVVDDAVVAEHRRLAGRNAFALEPRHYLEMLSHKHRAAGRAAVFADGRLPRSLMLLRDRYVERDSERGTKVWMQVVSLLANHSTIAVDNAVTHALRCNTDDPAAIALLLEPRRSHPTEKLDLSGHPELASFSPLTPDLNLYASAALAETI